MIAIKCLPPLAWHTACVGRAWQLAAAFGAVAFGAAACGGDETESSQPDAAAEGESEAEAEGGGPDMGTGGESESEGEPCDLLQQTGCEPGEACYAEIGVPPYCADEGTGRTGSDCLAQNDCAGGYFCTPDYDYNCCPWCPAGGTTQDCPAAHNCCERDGLPDGVWICFPGPC